MTLAKHIGQRNTRQRQIILDTLRDLDSHPTADELYRRVRRRLPRVSLGTIYRNLDLLVRCGVVRRLDTVGGQARFDGDLSRHAHVRCERCGQVDDVLMEMNLDRNYPASSRNGFIITGHRIEYTGVCPKCSNYQRPEVSDSAGESIDRGVAPEEKNNVEQKD